MLRFNDDAQETLDTVDVSEYQISYLIALAWQNCCNQLGK